jgi:hypothetical protein
MSESKSNKFNHGYALLVGVGLSAYPQWSLPVTVQDMKAIHSILTNPDLCAYPDDDQHIRLLHDKGATRGAILDGLSWLQAQVTTDPEATVVMYYSGHGWLDTSTGKYYLLPHDIKPFNLPSSALSGERFTEELRKITAERLLVFIDSCHAAGMATAKDKPVIEIPDHFIQSALPKGLVDDLKQGAGRAVFTSSLGKQKSWIRPDASLSIYTYHLIEALQGAGNQPGDTVVRVSNLMNYLGKSVPESALKLCQAEQTPFFDTATEDFPIAVLRGGKGLPADGWEAVQEEATDIIRDIVEIHIGRDMKDSIITVGDGNVIGDGSVSQVIKADRGSTISGVTQIAGKRK